MNAQKIATLVITGSLLVTVSSCANDDEGPSEEEVRETVSTKEEKIEVETLEKYTPKDKGDSTSHNEDGEAEKYMQSKNVGDGVRESGDDAGDILQILNYAQNGEVNIDTSDEDVRAFVDAAFVSQYGDRSLMLKDIIKGDVSLNDSQRKGVQKILQNSAFSAYYTGGDTSEADKAYLAMNAVSRSQGWGTDSLFYDIDVSKISRSDITVHENTAEVDVNNAITHTGGEWESRKEAGTDILKFVKKDGMWYQDISSDIESMRQTTMQHSDADDIK